MADHGSSNSTATIDPAHSDLGTVIRVRRNPWFADPLVHYGRHFGRNVDPFINIYNLLLLMLAPLECHRIENQEMTLDEARDLTVFDSLLHMIPGFEERLFRNQSSDNEIRRMSDLLMTGVRHAKKDDFFNLKFAVIDWITPHGTCLRPPLSRSDKRTRGFNHDATGALLCPVGLDWNDDATRRTLQNRNGYTSEDAWPIFIYKDHIYDPLDPGRGLLQSRLLIKAYRDIFVESACACEIHIVNLSSIVYAAAQLMFALSSYSVFSTDRATNPTPCQRFYRSLMAFLARPDKQDDADAVLAFWNQTYIKLQGGTETDSEPETETDLESPGSD